MSSTEPLTTGSLIDGRYRVDEVIGEGGFGRVYRGHHLVLESPIAVKTLRLDLGRDQREQSLRFLDEAKLLSKLRHPNIVRVIDAGVHPSTPPQGWLVIEWCDGVTLADELARSTGATRSVREVWSLLGPLVDAVATAHEADIVHRDLKPSNVMITTGPRGPEARLIDFGIAKAITRGEEEPSESRTSGRVAFTIAYAAPEQIGGTRTGPWTDVHALGLLLTEVLTGAPPYPRGEELHGVLDTNRRPTPGSFGVDVGAWEGVLARAVAFKSTDRYPSARALHDALERALPDLAHDRTASPSSLPEPAGTASARRSRPSRGEDRTEPETAVSAHSDRASGGSLDGPATITSAASSRELATSPAPREPTSNPRGRALGVALAVGLATTAGVVWLSRDDDAGSNAAASSTPTSAPSATAEATSAASTRPEVTSATTAQETATAQSSMASATTTVLTSARSGRALSPAPAASTSTSSATAHTTGAPSIAPSAPTARPTLQ